MNFRRLAQYLWVGLLSLVVGGCGGGSTTTAGGGTGGTGISVASRGTVSAVGSIWVNGIEYDTTGATITLADGSVYTDNSGTAGGRDLLPGMVVTVNGTYSGTLGRATSVTYSRALLGQISAVSSGVGGSVSSLIVLGQSVLVDTLSGFTHLQPTTNWTPAVGQWVEVSGFAQASALPSSHLHASFVKRVDNPPVSVAVSGTVTALDAMAGTFTLNGATVVRPPADYTLASLGLNDVVAVSGTTAGAGTTANPVQALHLEVISTGLVGSTDQEGEVEGVLEAAPVSDEFLLNGQRVLLGAGTVYLGGLASDLLAGVRLEVEGTLATDGRLNATRVRFEDSVEIEASIASYDSVNQSFTLTGLSGAISVLVDPNLTEIEPGLTLANEVSVKLRGRPALANGNQIVATKIEAGQGNGSVQLQGKLESINGSSAFVVLGTTISTSGMTFKLNDSNVSATTFLGQVAVGQVVEVDGIYNGASVNWLSADLEE